MKKLPIFFYQQEVSYTLKHKNKLRQWINQTILHEKHQLESLNFIFCSDNYLLTLNRQYLHHNTYTDIITFDNSETSGLIIGDIFISIDRIKENAKTFNSSFTNELHRVMIHGTLHLLGYKDKSAKAKKLMTQKEDEYLRER
ncbi:MAG: rRNA maturation RNase YbeY [Sphingobacteriales bacterium]|nr:MAG: rRNA maturation RNase YbeY [Sphingobacteriales bacterium]TAF81079.1 MAG: rRNA maturation RNase YbeY [Sphingobacteriales bacterium]